VSVTCSPLSLRLKLGKGRTEYRTYVSTSDRKITLFKDEKTVEGQSEPDTILHNVSGPKSSVLFLGVAPEKAFSSTDNLLVVKDDGEIQCLSGADLTALWTSPAAAISNHSTAADAKKHKVEYVTITDAHTASKGLLKAHQDALAIFPEEISADGYNPTLMVLVSSPSDELNAEARTLHVVALPRVAEGAALGQNHSVQTVLTISIPWIHATNPTKFGKLDYDIHVASGQIYELAGRNVTVYDFTEAIPKVKSQLTIDNVSSFLRLNNTSLLAASDSRLDIYNPAYRSIQASLNLEDVQPDAVSRKRKLDEDANGSAEVPCMLVSWSSKHNVVHAILSNQLVSFTIEARKDIPSRRRALGLLVDSLGCAVPSPTEKANLRDLGLSSLVSYIPGSGPNKHLEDVTPSLDAFVAAQDINGFEKLMAKELHMKRVEQNGVSAITDGKTEGEAPVPQWVWPASRKEYTLVDHRVIEYALSRIFTLTSGKEPKLIVSFYAPNVMNYLLETGNLNKPAIELALRNELHSALPISIPTGQLVSALVEVDPEFKVLFSLISHNYLDAGELVHAIRTLMQSLEIMGENKEKRLLLTGAADDQAAATATDDAEAQIEKEEEEASAALQLAESYLGDAESVRSQVLSLALSKLNLSPPAAVVAALQTELSGAEVVSLIYLLRFELARGSWTSKYLEGVQYENENEEGEGASQANSIVLLTSLINSAIDAIGSGGWLSGDAALLNGDAFESEELIESLKLEVSAALEGVEEATYLRGLVAEMVRYGETVVKTLPRSATDEGSGKRRKKDNRMVNPVTLPELGKDGGLLPLGLKVHSRVSRMRVGAGGEVQERSTRDLGRLKSMKVAKYSRERIVV
jgi:hypothetical protein